MGQPPLRCKDREWDAKLTTVFLIGDWQVSAKADAYTDADEWLELVAPSLAAFIYRATGNLRAVQILLGHNKIENTVRYLGIYVEDALALAENTEI